MPFVFLILGLLFIVVAVRNQTGNAITLLKSEFTGSNSFIQWFLAIMVLGLLGYIKPIKPVTNALLFLVLVAIVLQDGANGLFSKLENAFQNTQPITSGSNVASTQNASTLGQFAGALGGALPGSTALQISTPGIGNTVGALGGSAATVQTTGGTDYLHSLLYAGSAIGLPIQ